MSDQRAMIKKEEDNPKVNDDISEDDDMEDGPEITFKKGDSTQSLLFVY